MGMCMYRLTEVHGQEEQAPGGVGAAPMCYMAKNPHLQSRAEGLGGWNSFSQPGHRHFLCRRSGTLSAQSRTRG